MSLQGKSRILTLLSLLLPFRLLAFRSLLVLKSKIGLLRLSNSVDFGVYIGLNIRLFAYS